MAMNIYETYPIKESLLPFHFHLENLRPNLDYPNWHDDIEFLYCINEGGTVRCNGRQYEFKNNDVICINPGELHSSSTSGKFIYYCLIINSNFCKENGIDTGKLWFETYISDRKISKKFQNVVDAYANLHSFKNSEKNDLQLNIAKSTIRLAVLDLLVSLTTTHLISEKNSESQHEPTTNYAKQILEYISANISKNFTLDEIADHIGISKYHLAREFKYITGHTIIEQINILKCNEAKKLIESGKSVTEAATLLGFNDLPYFSQVFKKYMRVSPSKSRILTVERI